MMLFYESFRRGGESSPKTGELLRKIYGVLKENYKDTMTLDINIFMY